MSASDAMPAADAMWRFVERAYPICRSITGDGVRQTLALLGERIPLQVHEVPSGTRILDWTVPREWNLKSASIRGPRGEVIADVADHNLHVVSYSVPVRATLELEELLPHLHSLPERPDWIPYRTSYYQERWGFCLPHRVLESLRPGRYEVSIDATLEDGALTYGECFLPATAPGAGDTAGEVLVSAHVCHPSLANDNLSGLAVCMALAEALQARPQRRYGYRFVFAPGTIGAIAWLARNAGARARVAAGLVAANLGDAGAFHYKRSRRQTARDRSRRGRGAARPRRRARHRGLRSLRLRRAAVRLARLRSAGGRADAHARGAAIPSTTPRPTTSLSSRPIGSPSRSRSTCRWSICSKAIARYLNLSPVGEPQLGRRGLYGSLGGATDGRERELALLWVLNQSDGRHSLLDIAERSGVAFGRLRQAADALLAASLLREV